MQCEDASVTTCSLVPAELKMCCGLLQAALNLTDAQQVDMMYLWQIFNASLEALSRERKRLLSQVPTGTLESASQASIRFIDVANRAHQVHNNCVAGLKTCRQLTSAYNCGVRPNILAYLSLVHAESADSLTHTHTEQLSRTLRRKHVCAVAIRCKVINWVQACLSGARTHCLIHCALHSSALKCLVMHISIF